MSVLNREIYRDYLKYYRVVKAYIKIKYKLSEQKLDILLFLYSEPPFDRQRVSDYESILTWDKKRFEGLLRDGYIRSFKLTKHHKRVVYTLTVKSTNLIRKFYGYLEGDEIPTTVNKNPAFKKKVPYSHKVYRDMIKKMNAAIYAARRYREEGNEGYMEIEGTNYDIDFQ